PKTRSKNEQRKKEDNGFVISIEFESTFSHCFKINFTHSQFLHNSFSIASLLIHFISFFSLFPIFFLFRLLGLIELDCGDCLEWKLHFGF
ncbi:hypothetical protein A2U01_0031981, partial [Trifolium medium]|nr:hypothetical protein [Trifolium medium]